MILAGLILFLAALVHEDLGIVTAGYYVIERDVPITLAAVAVYLGDVTCKGILYGLGVAARRLPWAQRWLIGERVERARRRLEQRLVPAMVLCRFTPGLLFPTFLACGWLRVPFARFALSTALTAVLYVPLMLVLVVVFGEIARQQLSDWTWLV